MRWNDLRWRDGLYSIVGGLALFGMMAVFAAVFTTAAPPPHEIKPQAHGCDEPNAKLPALLTMDGEASTITLDADAGALSIKSKTTGAEIKLALAFKATRQPAVAIWGRDATAQGAAVATLFVNERGEGEIQIVQSGDANPLRVISKPERQ